MRPTPIRKLAAADHLFNRGIGNGGRDRYDALNAITEFIDHQRGRASNWARTASRLQIDKAIESATFGAGADLEAPRPGAAHPLDPLH